MEGCNAPKYLKGDDMKKLVLKTSCTYCGYKFKINPADVIDRIPAGKFTRCPFCKSESCLKVMK